jgi:hypothetical protein
LGACTDLHKSVTCPQLDPDGGDILALDPMNRILFAGTNGAGIYKKALRGAPSGPAGALTSFESE